MTILDRLLSFVVSDVSFISSVVSVSFPFIGVSSIGKRKRSPGAKSDEYDGGSVITVLFLAMCELMRVHGAKSMIDFFKILCISDQLLRTISSIPY